MAKKQLPIRRILVGALTALLLSAFIFVAYLVQQVQVPSSPGSPLIGTWKTEDGRVVNFRPDGTARYRGASNGKPNQILYFEWMIDNSNRLVICNQCSSQASAWKQRLNNWISSDDSRDLPMELVEVAETGFTVRSAEGIEFNYVPAEDMQMESAP